MKTGLVYFLASFCAGGLSAASLQDWTDLKSGGNIGSWADSAGSKVDFSVTKGPSGRSKALRLDSNLIQWGGVWTSVHGGLDAQGGLRFMAKAEQALRLSVILTDSEKMSVTHTIRLRAGTWQEFELPAQSFEKTVWQNSGAPSKGVFDLKKMVSINFGPVGAGASVVSIGPLDSLQSKPKLQDGEMGASTIQDFIALPASAYGPFADTQGSLMAMGVHAGGSRDGGSYATFAYTLKDQGWCGEWIRAGADWKGQDWTKAKTLQVIFSSEENLSFQVAFNDANQNAYQSKPAVVKAGAWRTVDFPFSSFSLNPNYQPPHAKKGAPLDLGNVEAFNVMPATFGSHAFRIR